MVEPGEIQEIYCKFCKDDFTLQQSDFIAHLKSHIPGITITFENSEQTLNKRDTKSENSVSKVEINNDQKLSKINQNSISGDIKSTFTVQNSNSTLKYEKSQDKISVKTDKNLILICETCGQTFKRKKNLKAHKYRIHESMPQKCHLCQKILSNEMNLVRHIKDNHSQNKSLLCDFCGKAFNRRDNLRKHKQQIHEKTAKKHPCEICKKIFSQSCHLNRHLKNIHGKN